MKINVGIRMPIEDLLQNLNYYCSRGQLTISDVKQTLADVEDRLNALNKRMAEHQQTLKQGNVSDKYYRGLLYEMNIDKFYYQAAVNELKDYIDTMKNNKDVSDGANEDVVAR